MAERSSPGVYKHRSHVLLYLCAANHADALRRERPAHFIGRAAARLDQKGSDEHLTGEPPTGRFTRNSQRHDAYCRMTPAMTGPATGASRTGCAIKPATRAMCLPAARAIIICAAWARRSPLTPCKTREPTAAN